MSCRAAMTYRGFIQRNTASDDVSGHPAPADFTALSTTPCYVWVMSGDTKHRPELSQDSSRYGGMFPSGTDVTSDDRLGKVQDRAGTQKFGVLYIDSVLERRDHLELRMRDHE